MKIKTKKIIKYTIGLPLLIVITIEYFYRYLKQNGYTDFWLYQIKNLWKI